VVQVRCLTPDIVLVPAVIRRSLEVPVALATQRVRREHAVERECLVERRGGCTVKEVA
jgi:hypothetical protein